MWLQGAWFQVSAQQNLEDISLCVLISEFTLPFGEFESGNSHYKHKRTNKQKRIDYTEQKLRSAHCRNVSTMQCPLQ